MDCLGLQPAMPHSVRNGGIRHLRNIRGILLECTELPPYADALRYHTGLPVWDSITAARR